MYIAWSLFPLFFSLTLTLYILSLSILSLSFINFHIPKFQTRGCLKKKELRELSKLKNTNLVIHTHELNLGGSNESSKLELDKSRPKKRIDKLLRDVATAAADDKKRRSSNNEDDNDDDDDDDDDDIIIGNSKNTVNLRFLLDPVKFQSRDDDPNRIKSVWMRRTTLKGLPGKQKAVPADDDDSIEEVQLVELEADLVR